MNERKDGASGKGAKGGREAEERTARRAAALRENLRKRKAQQRGRREGEPASDRDGSGN